MRVNPRYPARDGLWCASKISVIRDDGIAIRGGSPVLSKRFKMLLSKTYWLANGIILAVFHVGGTGGPANSAYIGPKKVSLHCSSIRWFRLN